MVVYHGTNQSFTEFMESTIGSKTDDGFAGRGFYFTSDPEVATSYAGVDNANIMPTFLKVENPYDFTGQNFYEVVESKGGPAGFTKWAQENGYDGAKLWSQYVVFSPNQIKSAVGNQGSFDPNSADITKGE